MPQFVVLEPGPEDLDALAAECAEDGVPVVHGFRAWVAPGKPPPLCVGRVRSAQDATEAVLAAVTGARLLVAAAAERDVVDQLLDDLRRLGEVDHRVGHSLPPALTQDQRVLLAHLLSGRTLGEAGRRLHLSRRTADRRLADARLSLGVNTTAEALRAAARLGVRPRRD